ncbi:MAG: phage protein Gp37 [Thermodesulfobacteriota bacterium]
MIAVIEEAIKTRIAEANLPYKPTVATYGGEFDEGLEAVVRSFPAIWVCFGGEGPGKPMSSNRRVWRFPATFVVMVAARNPRSEASTRRGDARQAGTYAMMADVRRLLLNEDLGLAIAELAPGRVRTLVNARFKNNSASAYAMEWHTSYDVVLGEAVLPEPLMLERVGLNYHLVPDDGVADAQDLVTLQDGGDS